MFLWLLGALLGALRGSLGALGMVLGVLRVLLGALIGNLYGEESALGDLGCQNVKNIEKPLVLCVKAEIMLLWLTN